MECPLRNDKETLQGPSVTFTQKEWHCSTEIMNDERTKNVWLKSATDRLETKGWGKYETREIEKIKRVAIPENFNRAIL